MKSSISESIKGGLDDNRVFLEQIDRVIDCLSEARSQMAILRKEVKESKTIDKYFKSALLEEIQRSSRIVFERQDMFMEHVGHLCNDLMIRVKDND